ncbi:MAG: epoxyqueuosine reductase QueH [Lachnospiraceae bacterium]|nr:epoxyqueuosine reductase QueH [Lachnospiraceae bacterium]
MNQRNYQKELEGILAEMEQKGDVPRLLLHSCCAPCSSYCLEYLSGHFHIIDFYYNPNITEKTEYEHRVREMERLIREQPHRFEVIFKEGTYEPERFLEAVKGYEMCREGGERCRICFRMRLMEAAEAAVREKCDFFTTTLTISPLKDARLLNEIGEKCGKEYGVRWLPTDFKKRGGYQRSIVLSREYDLYRQNYCGCVFSKRRDYGRLNGNSAQERR